MLARVFATATCLSVCLSVCLSGRPSVRHMPVLCVAERKQDREVYTVWYPHHSSFLQGMIHRKIRKGSPPKERAKWGWVGVFRRFSTNMSSYLENGAF